MCIHVLIYKYRYRYIEKKRGTMEIRVGSFVGAIKAGEKAPVSARQEWQTAPTSQHAAPIPPLQIGDAKLHRHQSNRVLLLVRFVPIPYTLFAVFSYFIFHNEFRITQDPR